MEPTECTRCGKKEVIGTYQFVKFDGKIQYLCEECWKEFRAWYNKISDEEKEKREK